jgi:predicted transcriptional regulator YdeE
MKHPEAPLKPTFIYKPAFTVVGLRLSTHPKSATIAKLWGEFAPRINELNDLAEPTVSYGVMTRAGNSLEYMAGCSVANIDVMPVGMTTWTIDNNTYAVFEATLGNLSKTFDYIFSTWLPTSDCKQVDSPLLERYSETFSPDNPVVSIYTLVQSSSLSVR